MKLILNVKLGATIKAGVDHEDADVTTLSRDETPKLKHLIVEEIPRLRN